MLHQLLRCHDITLSDAVKNRRLPVRVEMVNVRSFFNQDINGRAVALSDSVVDRKLLQAVLLRCFDAFLDKKLDQFDAAFLVFNCASIKQRSLLEGLVVLKICDVEAHLDDHADYFLNFCLLYFLKKLLVKRVAACIKSWLTNRLLILVLVPHCHVFVLHLLILRSFLVLKTKLHWQLNLLRFLDETHQLLVNGNMRGLDFGLDWENF